MSFHDLSLAVSDVAIQSKPEAEKTLTHLPPVMPVFSAAARIEAFPGQISDCCVLQGCCGPALGLP